MSVIIPFCSFLSITIRSGLLASIRLSHWIFMSHCTLISSFSTAPSTACSYHFSMCSNLFFLQISQWTFFATLSCRLLYYFWANFSQPLVMCCTLSPFFPNNLHRELSLVLSMWYFIWFVLIACSCAAHSNDSVPNFKSPLDNHCHIS